MEIAESLRTATAVETGKDGSPKIAAIFEADIAGLIRIETALLEGTAGSLSIAAAFEAERLALLNTGARNRGSSICT